MGIHLAGVKYIVSMPVSIEASSNNHIAVVDKLMKPLTDKYTNDSSYETQQ